MQKKLSKLQVYNVMLLFLEEFYQKDKSEYLGDILSSSEFWPNKRPGAQYYWNDWQETIDKTALQDKSLRNKNRLTVSQACHVMFNFVDNYVSYYDLKPDCLIELLKKLDLVLKKKDQEMWQLWLKISTQI